MKFLEKLTEWNNGISRGARAKFAKELKVTETTVMRWVNGDIPSEEKIRDMAKVLKMTEKEVINLFSESDGKQVQNVAGDNNGTMQQVVNIATKEDFDNFRREVKKEIECLNLKLDLILERIKK